MPTFEPQDGQPGKDVAWVPTPGELVQEMLELAKITAHDFVIDLGSGDGRIVIAAAARGARALGIEYDPGLVAISRRNAESAGVATRAGFVRADLLETDFSMATVVTMFLLPRVNMQLRSRILTMRPGTRVLSNTFHMEEWTADEMIAMRNYGNWCNALMWIVPARVEGTWKLEQGTLILTQRFQQLTGSMRSSGVVTPIASGRVRSDRITFAAGDVEYIGRVTGNAIEGTLTGGGGVSWRAIRDECPNPSP
jgi:precorrin-6B methylase 2